MRAQLLVTAVLSIALFRCVTIGRNDAQYAPALARARATVTALLQQYPGLNVAVAVDGRIVWSEGAGFADLSAQRRASASTRFRTYSSAKWITAALASRMADQNRVDLDAPLSRYLPGISPALTNVTLRQLLLHRGGVRHYREGEWLSVSNARCARAADALAVFIGDPLVAPPGTSYTYSSFGYVLASAVLEAAARQPFHELLADTILRPAGMSGTTVEPESGTAREATPYQKIDGQFRPAPQADSSCKFGAGGLMSTAEDLARFGIALTEGKLLRRESLQSMLKGEPTMPGRPAYGLGVVIEEDETLGRLASHSGGALGGRSFLLAAPDRRIVVAIAANFEGPALRNASVEIARAFSETKKGGPKAESHPILPRARGGSHLPFRQGVVSSIPTRPTSPHHD